MKLLRKLSIIICCLLFSFSSLLLGLDMFGVVERKDTDAITSTDTTSYVKVDEIWNGSKFKAETLNLLLQMVANNSSVSTGNMSTVNTLASSTRTADAIRSGTTGKTSGKDIVVRFAGLDWEVMYLSKDKSGNPILTLWLTNNYQEAWAGRNDSVSMFNGFYQGGYYSDWSRNWSSSDVSGVSPSNMYGTSYVRAIGLNNDSKYASSSTSGTNTSLGGFPSLNHPFAKFTMSSVSGNVTNYLVTPEQVSWQESGQVSNAHGISNNLSNENWSKSVSDSGFYSSSYNYAHKSDSDLWKNDYIWLPSFYEVGWTGWSGLWGASDNQRANYNGSTEGALSFSVGNSNSGSTYAHTMTRSTSYNSSSYIEALRPNGQYYNSTISLVSNSFAVRPALHLNLTKAASDSTVDLVDKNAARVDEIWTGSDINETNVNKLLQMVSNNSSVSTGNLSTIVSQATSTRNAADMRTGTTLKSNGQDIIVRFAGLDWQVMYLSTDKSGFPILTLWLDNNYQEAWAGRNDSLGVYHGFYNGGYYSDWSRNWSSTDVSISYPSNMYSSSYVRGAGLNIGSSYSGSETGPLYSYGQNSSHPFAKFTMSSVSENVTQYLVTPAQVSWQESGQNSKGDGYSYNCSNENWSKEISDDGFYSSANNYAHKTNSDAWKNDYIWLPSRYEVGYSNSGAGLWGASDNQRKNYDGSTVSISAAIGTANSSTIIYNHSITRTAIGNGGDQGRFVNVSSTTTQYLSVDKPLAVRPALHLNLYMLAGLKYNLEWDYNLKETESVDRSQSNVALGSTFAFPVPIKEGYSLTGWTHNGKTYSTNSDGSLNFVVQYLGDNNSAKRFKAVWTANKYSVTLNNQSADISSGTTSITATFDSILPDITIPKKRGYSFQGYFTSTSGGGTQYYTSEGKNITESNGTIRVWKETNVSTLYANWKANKYKIYYDAGGASGTMNYTEYEYSTSGNFALTSCTFTKPGSLFMYWLDSQYGYTYKDLASIPKSRYDEDITLVAQWQTTWGDYTSSGLSGEGTKDNPYLITSAADLAFLSLKVQEEDSSNWKYTTAYYKQTAHIDLSAHYWLPIGGCTIEQNPIGSNIKAFRGVYDGQHYSIKGINYYSQTNTNNVQLFNNVGLFGYTVGATIRNINLLSGSVTGYKRIGGLVGYAYTGLIENCTSYVNVSGDQACGMIGRAVGFIIKKCYNHGNITGREDIGGILGGNYETSGVTIIDCIAQCTVTGTNSSSSTYIAGLVGYSSTTSTISSSAFIGTVTNGRILVGSASSSTITDCYAESSTNINLYNSINSVKGTIYSAGGSKYYYQGSGDYSNWTMYNGKPLPGGLTWIGGLVLEGEVFSLTGYTKVG